MATNDADWVEDVRRWYFNGGRAVTSAEVEAPPRVAANDVADIGYEAAHPSLETASWSQPAATAFGTLR